VFRTYEPSRDRLVAVKAFRLDLLPEQAEALAEDLRVLVGRPLGHRSIITRIGAGLEGHVVYLAEEYVAAESLDVAVRHYAPASLATVLPYIRQLAGAIDLARGAGVGHGALHPRDIYLTPEEARATGFGVVDALERLGVRAPVRRPYSPPERVAAGPWGTQADVFALGAVTYELLTGRRPAGAVEVAALVGAATDRDRVASVLARALADEPSDRYATALSLADALERAARGEPEPAGHTAPLEPASAPADEVEPAAELEASPDSERVEDEPKGGDEDVDRETHPDLDEHDPDVPSLLDFAEPESPFDTGRPSAPAGRGDAGDADTPVHETQPEAEQEERPVPVGDHALDSPVSGWDARAVGTDLPDQAAGRAAFLPYAGTLVIGLLVGFLAGYGLGSREAGSGRPAGGVPGAPAATAPGAGGAQKPTWSEEAVEPKASAPAAAPAPASEGRLLVRSTPNGAEVRVNGTPRGTTPLTLADLGFGAYKVEVRREGYLPSAQEVLLSAGLPERELVFPLQAAGPRAAPPAPRPAAQPGAAAPQTAPPARPEATSGILVADTRPRGARVLLDGRPVGTTPLRLPGVAAGRHRVRFELEGYRPWTTEVTVVGGQENRVSGSLERGAS